MGTCTAANRPPNAEGLQNAATFHVNLGLAPRHGIGPEHIPAARPCTIRLSCPHSSSQRHAVTGHARSKPLAGCCSRDPRGKDLETKTNCLEGARSGNYCTYIHTQSVRETWTAAAGALEHTPRHNAAISQRKGAVRGGQTGSATRAESAQPRYESIGRRIQDARTRSCYRIASGVQRQGFVPWTGLNVN